MQRPSRTSVRIEAEARPTLARARRRAPGRRGASKGCPPAVCVQSRVGTHLCAHRRKTSILHGENCSRLFVRTKKTCSQAATNGEPARGGRRLGGLFVW